MGVGLAGRMEVGSLPPTLGEHICCSKAGREAKYITLVIDEISFHPSAMLELNVG